MSRIEVYIGIDWGVEKNQRRGCNTRARNALFYAARGAITNDSYFEILREEHKARGHGWARCVRGIGDKLITLLVGVLKSGKPYDKTRHGSRRRLEAGKEKAA